MAILKAKDIAKMNDKERNEKIKDLKMELVKNKIDAGKGGKMQGKEIKRTIARLHTFNRLNKKSVETK
ncbi:50S ribosomal protein L29 [archaeon]|jgi:ribosomal protein L29|nr:50S ribosomal protein L29 [archaeon]